MGGERHRFISLSQQRLQRAMVALRRFSAACHVCVCERERVCVCERETEIESVWESVCERERQRV